jgi:uncharacterized radical SAM superfamily protein
MVYAVDNRSDHCIIPCDMCGRHYLITYNRADMVDWLSGEKFIQDAMEYLSAGERELLISNTCESCFDLLYPA